MRSRGVGEGVYSGRGPIAEAGHTQAADGDIREEGRGATAPLANLPGKFAPAACTEADRKGESKLSVPESTFLYALFMLFFSGVIWPRQGWFHCKEAAEGWAGKEPAAGGI